MRPTKRGRLRRVLTRELSKIEALDDEQQRLVTLWLLPSLLDWHESEREREQRASTSTPQ